jgi:hypothetical protein
MRTQPALCVVLGYHEDQALKLGIETRSPLDLGDDRGIRVPVKKSDGASYSNAGGK